METDRIQQAIENSIIKLIQSGVAIKTIHSIELGKGNPAIKTILRIFNILELDFIVVSAKTTVNQ
jgi:DNA-binding XRE family transcriptional regulator